MSVFLVLLLVSQQVLGCVIAWSRVQLSVVYWLLLLCAGLPSFCDYFYYYYYYYYYYLRKMVVTTCDVHKPP